MGSVRTNIVILAFVALLLALGTWTVLDKIARISSAEVGHSLTTVRDTTHLAIKTWFNEQKAAAAAWADAPEIRKSTIELLAASPQQYSLLGTPALGKLRDWFHHMQKATHYQGFYIVGPDHINLASDYDHHIGVENLLLQQQDFFPGVWAGQPAVSLPVRSDASIVNRSGQRVSRSPSMFVAAPIHSDTGEVIAIFMFRLDPEEGFTNILNQGRIGNTGETYAFDGEGRLISQSRFDDQLHKLGLIPAGERAILNVKLLDPGVNLLEGHKSLIPRELQPLTHMANRAIKGETDIDLNGYRDYRGVPVVGAWIWDDELDLGVTTELDVEEAYLSLNATQLIIVFFSLFTFFLLICLTVIYMLFLQRKTAESQARKNAQLYLDIVETVIVALDKQGNILLINRKGCDLLGFREKELIGKNWFKSCLPEMQRETLLQEFEGVIEGKRGGQDYHESKIVTRSGEQRLIAWHNSYFPDKSGNLIGLLSSGNDITHRRLTEEALRDSETRFRLLVENIGKDYLIYRQDFDGTFQYVSPAIEHFLGLSNVNTVGRKWQDIFKVNSVSMERLESYTKKLQKGELIEPFEEKYIHPDKSERVVEIIARPQFNENGKSVAILGIIKDITEHKKIEEELRRAATVFDNTDEGIMVTNAEAEIILVNKAFSVISGYEPVDVLKKNPRFLKSGNHDQSFYQAMWGDLSKFGQWQGEIWNRRKNGEIYPAWESINVVKDEQGCITNYIAIFSDISILKESEQRLTQLAHHDALTGLSNRLRFTANLEQAIETAKRHKQNVALMFLDLDRFKYVNDTLGHSVGDQLLKAIAKRLKNCVRAEDTVARLGGDEFTVVLSEIIHAEDASLIADKIVKAIDKPFLIGTDTIDISTTVGISIFPDDATDFEGLMRAADTAMYHAKNSGRNRFEFFTRELESRNVDKMLVEQGLRKALKNGEFVLYYQPQIRLADGKIVGVEALIRWNHPKSGRLLPDSFIKVANHSNLSDSICEWVLRRAFNDSKKWSKNGSGGPRIAINISDSQISKEESIKHILAVHDELAPWPKILQLDLEITEAAFEHTDYTVDIINTLKSRGVMFAIDDFGTGYSSLSRLKQLPVDTIKIDQSFIHGIVDNSEDKAIAGAIIVLAHSLGLRVIGEGVETGAQLDVLRTLGCDEIQGFYFCEPVSADEITLLLDKSFQ